MLQGVGLREKSAANSRFTPITQFQSSNYIPYDCLCICIRAHNAGNSPSRIASSMRSTILLFSKSGKARGGTRVLDFTAAGHPGLLDWIACLSLTQVLRTFEQGLLSVGLIVGIFAGLSGFAALATVWLPPGVRVRNKVFRGLSAGQGCEG